MTTGVTEEGSAATAWCDLVLPPFDRLTTEPEKMRHYGADPLVREGWATLLGVLGESWALRFAVETGVLWLRPDVVAAGSARAVIARIAENGFVPVAASVVRVDRCGVRALWWWQLRRATAERLLLLDAVAELGPGLLVLYRHPEGDPARRLTRLKGGNDPSGRSADSLRSVVGSPNRVLTMVHTSDDPLDVVRELAVFLPWPARAALVASAWAGSPGSAAVLEAPLAAVRAAYRGRPDVAKGTGPTGLRREEAFAALVRATATPAPQRWPAVWDWSHRVPLVNDGSAQ